MLKNYFLAFLLMTGAIKLSAQYSSSNISLLGHWYDPAQIPEPSYGIKYNSVWGWVDAAHGNKEYAILGAGEGTHIIDVSNPTTPVEADFVAGRRNQVIWREYKTYGNYLYAISDDVSPNSLQIIDMSYLPDSVHVVYDSDTLFERSHTLYIDGNKLYCGSVHEASGGTYHSMAVYSLANPELPVFLRGLESDYPAINFAHDMMSKNDTVYASCGYQGLYIYKYDSVANKFTEISSLTAYPDQGYNHSSCMTPDGKTMIFCDEVPANKSVHILDISNFSSLSVVGMFKSNEGATAHNPYMSGDHHVVIAYYQDGLQTFDFSNPAAPYKTGFFDTDTLHGLNDGFPTSDTYHGAWGAYVDLPSGIILVGDMQNGLYVLDATVALGIHENTIASEDISVYPNPAANFVNVSLKLKQSTDLTFEIFDIGGRNVFSKSDNMMAGSSTKALAVNHLDKGMYVLRVSGPGISFAQKIIKQ
ncbi:MAG: choice-of-anchor B family protein [Bacteroidia bacterium]